MTRADALLLTPDEMRERRKAQKRINNKKYREENKEKIKEYDHTPSCKKSRALSNWKRRGLQESPENLDRIYNMWLTQELCNACDCILTRDGRTGTRAEMDHNHSTHRFRHIICHACNTHDSWMQYFC
tara:strand:- start:425 stop:808 length:384 start_codon:yes stop_codon:yes gene_type:complete